MPSNAIGSALANALRAVCDVLPCLPCATAAPEPDIELEPRVSANRTSAPQQPLPVQSFGDVRSTRSVRSARSDASSLTESEPDDATDNLRRMRLQHTAHGRPKLKHLKFEGPNDSSHPERERQRQIEQHPLFASLLNQRLGALPRHQPLSQRQFTLDESRDVKGLGFNASGPAATTGTSRPNVLCVTDGMGPCIAVALAAEKIDPEGQGRLPGAKARVLHIHPTLSSSEVVQTLQARVEKYQGSGLTVKAALHGGWHFNEPTAATIRSTLTDLGVAIEFDESGDKRNGNTPLGAVVQDDHSVRFVTELGYRT